MTVAPPTPVDAYFDALEGDAQRIAAEFRDVILRAAPDVGETIRYQMPCFVVEGQYFVHLGAWKRHIGLYPIARLDGDLEDGIEPYRAAKDTVQFRYAEPVPWDLVERLIAELIMRSRS